MTKEHTPEGKEGLSLKNGFTVVEGRVSELDQKIRASHAALEQSIRAKGGPKAESLLEKLAKVTLRAQSKLKALSAVAILSLAASSPALAGEGSADAPTLDTPNLTAPGDSNLSPELQEISAESIATSVKNLGLILDTIDPTTLIKERAEKEVGSVEKKIKEAGTNLQKMVGSNTSPLERAKAGFSLTENPLGDRLLSNAPALTQLRALASMHTVYEKSGPSGVAKAAIEILASINPATRILFALYKFSTRETDTGVRSEIKGPAQNEEKDESTALDIEQPPKPEIKG